MNMRKGSKHRKSKSSTVVTFRLDNDVLRRLRKNHPRVSEYLRQRITYDVTRKHRRGKWYELEK